MSDPKYAISIKGIKKIYRATREGQEKYALKGFDLQVLRGSMFALLGPNGAGKSTLINIIAGMTDKTSGSIKVWNFDMDTQRRNIKGAVGVVPQELNIDPFFSAIQLLDLHAGIYGIPKSERRTEEILHTVGLWEMRDAYSRKLSGGMRRRLLIAKAMVHSPPILILDEPSAGVDVELREQLWGNIRTLNAQGTTILLTTHYLEEAEELCDHIAVIDEGNLIVDESKKDLLKRMDKKILHITFVENIEKLAFLDQKMREIPQVTYSVVDDYTAKFVFAPSAVLTETILNKLKKEHLTIKDIVSKDIHLKDIFLKITDKRNT